MSTNITYSDPFYNQILSKKSQLCPYSRHVPFGKPSVQSKKINKSLNFVNSNAKNGIFTVRCISANSTGSNAPAPGKSPFFGWKWLLGFLLPILLPSFRNKVNPFQLLKNNLHKVVETVETVTEIVEEVAEQVDKLAEEVQEKLPEDSQLRKGIHSIEQLAEDAVKRANQAHDIIDKVQDIEKEMEDTVQMQTNTTNQVEKVSQELSAEKKSSPS